MNLKLNSTPTPRLAGPGGGAAPSLQAPIASAVPLANAGTYPTWDLTGPFIKGSILKTNQATAPTGWQFYLGTAGTGNPTSNPGDWSASYPVANGSDSLHWQAQQLDGVFAVKGICRYVAGGQNSPWSNVVDLAPLAVIHGELAYSWSGADPLFWQIYGYEGGVWVKENDQTGTGFDGIDRHGPPGGTLVGIPVFLVGTGSLGVEVTPHSNTLPALTLRDDSGDLSWTFAGPDPVSWKLIYSDDDEFTWQTMDLGGAAGSDREWNSQENGPPFPDGRVMMLVGVNAFGFEITLRSNKVTVSA